MTYWRQAGLTYLQFSQIAARAVRRALKADKRPDPMREQSTIKQVAAKSSN